MTPYGVGGGHRHTPEMIQNLVARPPASASPSPSRRPSRPCPAASSPRAAPRPSPASPPSPLRAAYEKAFADEPFVHLLPEGQWPATGVRLRFQRRSGPGRVRRGRAAAIIAISAIDNLTKGTAGGAVQSMNIALGLPEDHGAFHDRSRTVSVTAAKGFTAAGIAAGIKENGNPDLALVVNNGPRLRRRGRLHLQPRQGRPGALVRAGPQGRPGLRRRPQLRRRQRLYGPQGLPGHPRHRREGRRGARAHSAGEVAVASTGLIGVLLPMDKLLPGVETAAAQLSEHGGEKAAIAIKTTDTVHKTAVARKATAGPSAAWPRARACSPPASPPCSSSSPPTPTSTAHVLDKALRAATRYDLRPGRLRRLHVHQRHRAAARLRRLRRHPGARRSSPRPYAPSATTSPGSSSATPRAPARTSGSRWSTPRPRTTPSRWAAPSPATTSSSAPSTARTPTGAGCSPPSAPPSAAFEPDRLNVAINGVWVCKNGSVGEDRDKVDMRYREVHITADLAAGTESAVDLDQRPHRRLRPREQRVLLMSTRPPASTPPCPRPRSSSRRCPG